MVSGEANPQVVGKSDQDRGGQGHAKDPPEKAAGGEPTTGPPSRKPDGGPPEGEEGVEERHLRKAGIEGQGDRTGGEDDPTATPAPHGLDAKQEPGEEGDRVDRG